MPATVANEAAKVGEYDERYPLYLGTWKQNKQKKQTTYDNLDEPHLKRKKLMLKKYPQIKELYGSDPALAFITLLGVSMQVGLAYFIGRMWENPQWYYLLGLAYVIGGTWVSIFGVITHEVGHDVVLSTPMQNRMLGFFLNIPLMFPIVHSFRRYHAEHHQYQGVVGMDPDLPIAAEVELISNYPWLKIPWMLCYGPMYVVRGAALNRSPSFWEKINVAVTIFTDLMLYNLVGGRGIAYLMLSVFAGYGIHVGAAHFIQEHYTFIDGQETYSYYGSGNKVFFNIGYHNEHHDFPQVPWSRTPLIKKIAPEFYDSLYYHTSWFWVMYTFLSSATLGAHSRLVRTKEVHMKARMLKTHDE